MVKAGTTQKLSSSRKAKAEGIIKKIRKNHALGIRILDANSAVKFATDKGLDVDLARKMKLFAETCDKDELEELCSLRRPDHMPLQWGHIRNLISIKGRGSRMRLARQAAQKGWTADEIFKNIPKRFKRQEGRGGGRPLKTPNDPDQALGQICKEADRLCRRLKMLLEASGKYSPDIAQNATGTLRQLQRLADKATVRLKQS
jgi:hypothetical protein